jgi:hypothetical protein
MGMRNPHFGCRQPVEVLRREVPLGAALPAGSQRSRGTRATRVLSSFKAILSRQPYGGIGVTDARGGERMEYATESGGTSRDVRISDSSPRVCYAACREERSDNKHS